MIQITKTSDKITKKNIVNRYGDIPGGVSVVLSDLPVGAIIPEATPLSVPSSGKRSICKSAVILTGSSTTVFKVASETNQFKVGDFLMRIVGGLAYAITVVTDNGDETTSLTVGTALESATVGGYIYQAAAQSATTTSALKYTADVILKEGFVVPSASQVIWIADAYLRADVVESSIAPLHLATLDVKEVKY